MRPTFQILIAFSVIAASLVLAIGSAAAQDNRFQIPATDNGLPGEGPIRRAGWFQERWTQRRSGFASRAEQERGAVVFLGDSITQGWGDDLRGVFGDMKVANRGIGGDTTRGMLIRLEEDVLSLDPAAVVILMGTNDLEEHAEPPTIAVNFKLIIAALKAHNDKMPIVVCQVFPSHASKTRPADKIQEINRLYAEAVIGDPQITIIETYTLFADADGNAKIEEFPDLLHPNEVGYAKWTAALRPILATKGFVETEPDEFMVEEGFVSLFNGKDLSGWGLRPTSQADLRTRNGWRGRPAWPVITEASAFEGTETNDRRLLAKNGRLVVTTPPEGRKIQQFFANKDFPSDFVLKLEFRATPNADSGIYIRGNQLQCRDYALAGPYTELQSYKPQDWNEVVITVTGNTAYCTCNGEVLEEAFRIPDTGPIGVEGDRGQVEYRRIRIKETP